MVNAFSSFMLVLPSSRYYMVKRSNGVYSSPECLRIVRATADRSSSP